MRNSRVKEDITTLNVYAPKNKASKYKKQNLTASHKKMSDFNINSLVMDRTDRQNAHTLVLRMFLLSEVNYPTKAH